MKRKAFIFALAAGCLAWSFAGCAKTEKSAKPATESSPKAEKAVEAATNTADADAPEKSILNMDFKPEKYSAAKAIEALDEFLEAKKAAEEGKVVVGDSLLGKDIPLTLKNRAQEVFFVPGKGFVVSAKLATGEGTDYDVDFWLAESPGDQLVVAQTVIAAVNGQARVTNYPEGMKKQPVK